MGRTEFWMRPIRKGVDGETDYTDKFRFMFFYANTSSRWWIYRETDDLGQMFAEITKVRELKRFVFEMNFKHLPHIYLKELRDQHTKFTLLLGFRLLQLNGSLYMEKQFNLKEAELTDYHFGMDSASLQGEVLFKTSSESATGTPSVD